jgi:hypothetical protein
MTPPGSKDGRSDGYKSFHTLFYRRLPWVPADEGFDYVAYSPRHPWRLFFTAHYTSIECPAY